MHSTHAATSRVEKLAPVNSRLTMAITYDVGCVAKDSSAFRWAAVAAVEMRAAVEAALVAETLDVVVGERKVNQSKT